VQSKKKRENFATVEKNNSKKGGMAYGGVLFVAHDVHGAHLTFEATESGGCRLLL